MDEQMIYVDWAFTANAKNKAKENYEKFRELLQRLRITCVWKNIKGDFKNYDLVYMATHKYKYNDYKIIKNTTNLSDDEVALILDAGNLCFGYHKVEENVYRVYQE